MFGREARSERRAGYAAFEAEDWSTAARYLERAAAIAGDRRRTALLFDAALAHKFDRQWQAAFDIGLRAVEGLAHGQEEPAFWNLGIAATILRRWDVARSSWARYGLDVPEGDGEIDLPLGACCVRIDTDAGYEVAWAERLCPARARIVSVPFDSTRRFGEIVVHDGVPNGERVVNDETFPVFDELERFQESSLATLTATVVAPGHEDVTALKDAFVRAGFGAEPVACVARCACCSRGTVILEDDLSEGEVTFLLAAPRPEAERLLDTWVLAGAGRQRSPLSLLASTK